ncbi:MAG: TIGR01777 family protein [Pyrinomonadaceae bacterium]|nr:TIGR01777 family protein [Pyrinomonadaceae bacterium]
MKIIVSGATGLVGRALLPSLRADGHQVTSLVRKQTGTGSEVLWNPAAGQLDAAGLEGYEAIVHLAGENVGEGRWTEEKKQSIRDSRVQGTSLLAGALARLATPPRVFVSASAIGYYGDRGAEVLTEESAPGADFLSGVCREWEAAADAARAAGIRVVSLRFGVILSADGGALKKMLTPFKLGAGGQVGGGEQYMSWLTLDDAVGAIKHALSREDLRGAVNVVAPHPATNGEFTKTLGKVLGRPTFFPVPAFAARLAFGEMADALLLASTRVEPARLKATGYQFKHPQLENGLRHTLGK